MKPRILAGLIGAGIQASRTPALHEQEGDAQGLRYLYRLIDLEPLHLDTNALPDLLDAAELMHFTGLNITYPCKQAILPLLDELSDEARGIGAVNTVVFKNGKRIGHNTDCLGFAEGFRRNLKDVARQRVVQMGAGGAGAAVAHALLAEGVQQLCIFDVDSSRAATLWITSPSVSAPVGPKWAANWKMPWPRPMAWSTPRRWAWPSCQAHRFRPPGYALNCGWRRSCISRWKPNCCGMPAPWVAVPWMAATWRCFRR